MTAHANNVSFTELESMLEPLKLQWYAIMDAGGLHAHGLCTISSLPEQTSSRLSAKSIDLPLSA